MDDPHTPDPDLVALLAAWEERSSAVPSVTPEEVCRDRPDLLGEFRRLLAGLRRVDDLLGVTARGGDTFPSIPGFEVLGELGRGGMGVVYKARDVALDKVVAIKVPVAPGTPAVPPGRFEREARTLARLEHPNIVPIHSYGLAAGAPYFVMDYLPGGDLSRLKGSASVAEVVACVEHVARAVDHAHKAGVVHRDLKPSNILLDRLGRPRVSDFGVAALLGPPPGPLPAPAAVGSPGPARWTRTGAVVGTPQYAAPEAFQGPACRLSPAADVWSLGVILYEMLTGRLPFRSAGAEGLARAIAEQPPPPPRSVRPDVPAGVEGIVLRCLAKRPADRYRSAGELAEALARWRRGVRVRRAVKLSGLVLAAAAATLGWLATLLRPEGLAARHARVSRDQVAALARDGRVELVPAVGPPRTYRPVVNTGLAEIRASPDGPFSVFSPRPCLVELLPRVPFDRYRLTAEVRQEAGLNDTEAGLYFCHSESDGARPVHRFAYLTFADIGLLAHKFPGPSGEAGSALNLRCFRYGPPDPPDGVWQTLNVRWAWYRPPEAAGTHPGPWRRLRVEVSPDSISCSCGDLALPAAPAKFVKEFLGTGDGLRGGLGLYLDSCRVGVRNVTVERVHTL